jgi:hypothetical protein
MYETVMALLILSVGLMYCSDSIVMLLSGNQVAEQEGIVRFQ